MSPQHSDTDLQDVKDFTGTYTVRGYWDPVTETGTETQVTYGGARSAGAI